jgi:hypothetical protein
VLEFTVPGCARYGKPMVGDSAAPPSDTGFEIVRRGYDQVQVDAHLRRLDAEVSILVTDRDAAMDQSAQLTRELDDARVRAERLRAQVRTLVSPPQSVQGMSERMRSMLRLAEDEVAEMLGRADTEVTRRTHEAEVAAAQTIAAATADADAVRAAARADAARVAEELAQARSDFAAERKAGEEQLLADRDAENRRVAEQSLRARQEHERVLAEAQARRAEVDEDFTLAMDQRRSEALAAFATQQLEARREIEARREAAAAKAREEVAGAEAQARRLVADAERRVREITALRARVAEQLGGTRAVLDRSLGALAPLPEELGAPGAAGTGAVDVVGPEAADPEPTRSASGDGSASAAAHVEHPGAENEPAEAGAEDSGTEDSGTENAEAGTENDVDGAAPRQPSPRRRTRRSKTAAGRR